MILDLDDEEAGALMRALDNYLPVLAVEAARTDRVADAHELWERYRRLEAVRGRLGRLGAWISTAAGAPG